MFSHVLKYVCMSCCINDVDVRLIGVVYPVNMAYAVRARIVSLSIAVAMAVTASDPSADTITQVGLIDLIVSLIDSCV